MTLRLHRLIFLIVCLSLLVKLIYVAEPPVMAQANSPRVFPAVPARPTAHSRQIAIPRKSVVPKRIP